MKPGLLFLKLGGSLITDKSSVHSAKRDVISRIAYEIREFHEKNPDVRLLLGHGSGSFAHVPAAKYGTRNGVQTAAEWVGFVEVWKEARELNCIVMQELIAAGLPAIAFSPCSQITARERRIVNWDLQGITASLSQGLIPVVYGDTIFDTSIGGTIFSTEELFVHLANQLHPERILISGIENGIWQDFPDRTKLIEKLFSSNLDEFDRNISGSENEDVTGGMRSKVREMGMLVEGHACREVIIFSGLVPGNIFDALSGKSIGTSLVAG